jgi:Glucose / Sorbosone dehydrogenase
MRVRFAALVAGCAVVMGAVAAAGTAAGSPVPRTYGGAKASVYATTGLLNVTSFAWDGSTMFAGSSGNSQKVPNGGVYVIRNGTGTEIPGGPIFVGGMAFHGGALYLSGAFVGAAGPSWQIAKWSGWNGATFASRKTIYTAPATFQGFNGVAFGPDGRLYVGVDTGLLNGNDHGPASLSPYLYDILSMTASGKDVKVFSSGIRQPWQLAFAPGSTTPFVSDLGQDSAAKNPPDFVLEVKQGENYGFPACNWTAATKKACQKYAKPFLTFSPHFDPMGLAVIGTTLYIESWTGLHAKGEGAVYETSLRGGKVKPVVTGLPFAADALAAHDGYLYAGGATEESAGPGMIYQVKP